MADATGKRLMIIGGTWEQEPLVRTAREMGCHLLVTDPNPRADALALADESAILDPRDLPRMLALAQSFRPDGITADECDYSHFAATFVAHRLGLPNDGLEAAQVTTNKFWMRQQCRERRAPQPRFFPCHTLSEAQEAAELIGWPVIVKPVDNRGSYGVNIAEGAAALPGMFLEGVMHAHSRQVLVEAYVSGAHITVDGCVDQSGRHHNLAMASKRVIPGHRPIIVEVNYPAEVSPEIRERVLAVNQQVVEALGIRGGLTHSEYIVDAKERVFLVETANRGGGVWTSARIVPHVSGVDVSRLLIHNALGLPFQVTPTPRPGVVVLAFLIFEPGPLRELHGLEEAAAMDGVLGIRLAVKPGEEIRVPRSGGERHGFALLAGADRHSVDQLLQRVKETLRLDYA